MKRKLSSIYLILLLCLATAQKAESASQNIGAGFFINNEKILTNKHVVYGCKTLKVRPIETQKWYPAKIIATDSHEDLAIIQTTKGYGSHAILSNKRNLEVGTVLFSPLFKRKASGHRTSKHEMQYLHVINPDDRIKTNRPEDGKLVMRDRVTSLSKNKINPGDSGSPVFNESLYLVGIVSNIQISDTYTYYQGSRYEKDKLIATIPIKRIERFLKRTNTAYKKEPEPAQTKAFTVQILCTK